jgi:hypothetical protein
MGFEVFGLFVEDDVYVLGTIGSFVRTDKTGDIAFFREFSIDRLFDGVFDGVFVAQRPLFCH